MTTNDRESSNGSFWTRFHEKLQLVKPLLVSHHPDCEKYNNHVFRIKNSRFCIGCFVGYPIAFLGLFLFYFLFFPRMEPVVALWWLFIGIGCFLFLGLSFTSATENKFIKISQKAIVGFGGSVIIAYILFQSLNLNWFWFLINLLGLGLLFITPISILRYRSMAKMCGECEWREDPSKCPLSSYFSKNPENSSL